MHDFFDTLFIYDPLQSNCSKKKPLNLDVMGVSKNILGSSTDIDGKMCKFLRKPVYRIY